MTSPIPLTTGLAAINTITTRPAAYLGLLLGVALLLARDVFAHAGYVRSSPGEKAIVAEAPGRVEIWFSQELFRRQDENWIRVIGPGGAAVHSGEAQIDDDDRAHMWVDLQGDLPPGEFRVTWHSLSAEDGDTDEGAFAFTVDPSAEVTSTPMLAAPLATMPPASPTAGATDLAVVTPTAAAQSTETGSGSGCFAGLFPLVGLVALAGFAVGKRKR